MKESEKSLESKSEKLVPTCSGLRPGGTQAYSSSAQPESSSDVELLWHPKANLLILGSISKGIIIMKFQNLAPQSQDIQWRLLWVIEEKQMLEKKSSTKSFKVIAVFNVDSQRK